MESRQLIAYKEKKSYEQAAPQAEAIRVQVEEEKLQREKNGISWEIFQVVVGTTTNIHKDVAARK